MFILFSTHQHALWTSTLRNPESPKPSNRARVAIVQPPSEAEKKGFFEGLRTLMPTSAILTCVYPSQRPRPNPLPLHHLPSTILSLYQPAYKELTSCDMQARCREVFSGLRLTEDEAAYLAEATKLQSKSLLWFEHRRARITASKFHAVSHTSATSPSRSRYQKWPIRAWT